MSREGANNRIDAIKNSLNTDQYSRSALGNAVRFNTMLNLIDDFSSTEVEGKSTVFTKDQFASALETSVVELRDEFNAAVENERQSIDKRFDTSSTIQQKLQNRAYKTSLGQTVANSTVQRKGMYQDFNTSYSSGATGAFRSFTNGFVQDDEDYFGSRVIYDNVFGQYEDGGESLSNKTRLAMSDPTNDNRTVTEKVLDNVVNKSIYDQTEIVDRIDVEFGRFHGNSMIDQMSMTGSGLKSARSTIRKVMQEGSAFARQVDLKGGEDHPIVIAQALSERTSFDLETTNTALNLLNNNLSNRSSTSVSPEGGYVNKAGVAEFVDLINSAGTRDSNGALTGGRISITSFQFQNETISAALSDKIQRHVLNSVLQGGGAPLEIDMTLAYPRQRNVDKKQNTDGRYAVGMTNYGILGPNLIEAMKLQEVKHDVEDMLVGLGVAKEEIGKYVNLNIQFRDKKFHPKIYLTDNIAAFGTQNLTAPVGSSINQAGSNFETMRFVTNTFKDNTELQQARGNFVSLGQAGLNQVYNNQVTQSLLYRQIVDSVDQEKEYAALSEFNRTQGNTSTPILNNKLGAQLGFAGDIYQHLSNTLEFAHNTTFNTSHSFQKVNFKSTSSLHMFMLLDQAFMLQLGSNTFAKQLKGEMGEEIGTPYSKKDKQTEQYQIQQNKLFDLLIADKANVVVDAKNYREQVMNPLLEKINEKVKNTDIAKNQKLVSNFEKYGQSLSIMAGFDLFKPSASKDSKEYDTSLNIMFKELRRLGFTKKSGFDDSDLKQIIGIASGNIESANVPRQHAKGAALYQYDATKEDPTLISYYQGSSNMGLYSLGIGSGKNGQYLEGDGNLTNTEFGIMLGRGDINTNLSRRSSDNLSVSPEFATVNNMLSNSVNEWALNQEEETHELMLAQQHFSTTWNQLARSSIINPQLKSFNNAPIWQDNVNTKDLMVLKKRLETMRTQLGLSSDVFSVIERYGDKSGSGLTSINVSIDMNKVMKSTEFMSPSSNLPKLNFELSVLSGPSSEKALFNESSSKDIPGFVYFVDKNRIVGNGLFTNDSGNSISVLGRRNYEDDAETDLNKGRVTLKSGQSAHMSSLDLVPQLFATLMGEALSRFGTKSSMKIFDNSLSNGSFNRESVQKLLLDYVAISLTGYSTQIDESRDSGSNIISSMKQIQDNLNLISLQDLNETINRHTRSKENTMDSDLYNSLNLLEDRKQKNSVAESLKNLNNTWFHHLKGNNTMSEDDVHTYINDVYELAKQSPQLANMIVKTAYKDSNASSKKEAFNKFQTLLFGSFLQTKDERTYGGQQGFYKTLLMGVGNSSADIRTSELMLDLDENNNSLHNLKAYARFKPLEYNPLTDIHDILYRSIASKSTSLSKNSSDLDSLMLQSEARDLGDAANLRLMSSIGIGTTLVRDDFIIKNQQGDLEIGANQKEIFEAMRQVMIASSSDPTALSTARQNYLESVASEFGSLDSDARKDTIRLSFYTGSQKKLSQLPQRIKNAMGSRPMYSFSIDAQMALERGESLTDLSDSYLQQYRQPLLAASKSKVEALLNKRDNLISLYGEDSSKVLKIDSQIDDLKIIGAKAFNSKVAGLGAVFSGRIKSVLNQEQVNFITATKNRLQDAMGDLIEEGQLDQNVLDELLRVEVLKAGLTNKGLGKMIAGNDHMKYSIALIQLSGTYNDTSLNNPLYGTVYTSKEKYKELREKGLDIYDKSLSAIDREKEGVYTLGIKEGQYNTQQKSIKSSLIGAGGIEVLLQADDIIVEDKDTGSFVHKRKVEGEWQIIGQVDDSRNVQAIKNVVDRTGFSEVGTPGLGSSTISTYGRKGENSIDYIYGVKNRAGNFANNEYLVTFDRIEAINSASGRRVEGTDSGALIKAVAVFAGRIKYAQIQNNSLVHKEMNVFENIEQQILESYNKGEIKGSLKSYLDFRDETQRVTLQDGRTGYAPLSSSIHGLYNANNFKSFFWSHGATILRAQEQNAQGIQSNFILEGLFNTEKHIVQDNAKKLVAALLVNFGTDFLLENKDPSQQSSITNLKRSLINEMIKGEFGSHYQRVALETTRTLGGRVDEIFNNKTLREGRSREEITGDLLYSKIGNQVGFNSLSLGALNAISSTSLEKVLAGDTAESAHLLNLVKRGMLDPVSKRANAIGGINFNNKADQQAALITTAVDLMHQVTSQGSKLRIPSDVDFDNDKVKDILLTLIGSNKDLKNEDTDDIMQFLSGVNSSVATIAVFTDIVFSSSKDPTSTQSVGRHEAQHLITPFLGDIQKYQKEGKLSSIQHTIGSITAMVTGTTSGLVFYDSMAKSQFGEKQAADLTSSDNDYLFTSFNKQKFLGFYQKGVSGVTTDHFVKQYKAINKALLKGDYDWESFQTKRDIDDFTKLENLEDIDSISYKQVTKFIDKFHVGASDLEKARLLDQYLLLGGDKFALHQLNELTNMMSQENARYQADPSKSKGVATAETLLNNVKNSQMFFSVPDLDFEMQNGEIVTRTSGKGLISTILPSSQEMAVLSTTYGEFTDFVLKHYTNLSAIFVPGTVANTAFEKVRIASRENRAIILSTEEYKSMASLMDSARMMPLELAKTSANSFTQEAFAGKNKYQGFTATGIGNLLVPFGSIALSQTKLDEAGIKENSERFELIRQSNLKIQELQQLDNDPNTKTLNTNLTNFYRRQKAAEAQGISIALEVDFKNMKKEALKVKNQIINFVEVVTLPQEEKQKAFDTLKEQIKLKRDNAYSLASLNFETGSSLSNKDSKNSLRLPTEADRYIYHAQALNYDVMLTELLLIGHQANLEPLSAQVVQDLNTRRKEINKVEFLLNSFEDKQGSATFVGLSQKQSNLPPSALFTNKSIDESGGLVGQHMKTIASLFSELRSLGFTKESNLVGSQYVVQQIDTTIEMYEKKLQEMDKFSVEREVHTTQKDIEGNLVISDAVRHKINTATSEYTSLNKEVVDFLRNKKAQIMSQLNPSPQDIRQIFEDIDMKIAEVDKANIHLAEVFRSPPPGETDPRIHTYRVMQGVAALNQYSAMLSDNKEIGSSDKMLYSTERGQTATMMASLGVVTLGGGDFDGDPYTVVFHQIQNIQQARRSYKGKMDQHKLMIDNLNSETNKYQELIASLDPSNSKQLKQKEKLEARLDELKTTRAEKEQLLLSDTEEFNKTKRDLDQQLSDGHKSFQSRARKQVANYMGIDERFFVSQDELMYDNKGKLILDEDGVAEKGFNSVKTYDADALSALLEKGYNLMEGVASNQGKILGIMNSLDTLLGYKSQPDVFRKGVFLEELVDPVNLIKSSEGKISAESPSVHMLKGRVNTLLNNVDNLTPEQKQFVTNLKDSSDSNYIAYLEQFNILQQEMNKAAGLHNLQNLQKAEDKQKEFNKRAFMNEWIGGNIYADVTGDSTLSKFMGQGVGMTLTEGTFDMTLKTLGKAGGEVLGKTYNTIIGTTFQDAPIITYGRQMLDTESELHKSTKTEFQKQLEGDTNKVLEIEAQVASSGLQKGTPEFKKAVEEQLRKISYESFDEYIKTTQKALLKSEGTQGFMKNIHQLLRDSIKLKDNDGKLMGRLQEASDEYDRLSIQISAHDDIEGDLQVKKDLITNRDKIIAQMASNLGPGPGLKSLIDLDYLTNEGRRGGLSKNEFESRFGSLEHNKQMLNHYSESMDLTSQEKSNLQDTTSITDESSALLKVARNITAKNISNLVTSFRMDAVAVDGRHEILKGFARDHKAQLATKLGHHTITNSPRSVTQDGIISQSDEAGKYIQEKYGIIESEHSTASFDSNRQHKNALGSHLGIEESAIYNDDGTIAQTYKDKLNQVSKKLNISSEEYTLMFDIHHEQSKKQVEGLFGPDGQKMEQFTVMNLMRKDIARTMLNGQLPSAETSKTINESIGSEVLTTMAQLASQNKLDSQGQEIFSGMYKGVVAHLLDATDNVVEVVKKSDGNIIKLKFTEMTPQQKSTYLTKLLYQTMLGTDTSNESGFTRSTSEEARQFKEINARLIANSTLELDDIEGSLQGKLSNGFIDALDSAGSHTLTGQQIEAGVALGEEFLRSAAGNEDQFDSLMKQYLPNKGNASHNQKTDNYYRSQMKKKVSAQIKIRQESDSQKYAVSRSRHGKTQTVMNRSSFMNKINTSAIDQLSSTSGSNTLDLFIPFALTALGSVISESSVDSDELMQFGGAMFTSFQYARTGTIESTQLDPSQYKKRLLNASALGGIFKFKNALSRNGDENIGQAIAQVAIQETTAAVLNTSLTPWLSKNIAEHGLGVKHAPSLNALDMKKYQAGQQLAGNIGASIISAVSSTLISGLLMRGVESMSASLSDTIQSFLPAVQAVSAVNESISRRRQQEAAYQDFDAETDNSEGHVSDYLVLTTSTYNPDDYSTIADLQEDVDLEPSSDGSLSFNLLA